MEDKKLNLIQAFKVHEEFLVTKGLDFLVNKESTETSVKMNISYSKLEGDDQMKNAYEVSLSIEAETSLVEKAEILHIAKVSYSGLFEIAGLTEEEIRYVASTNCATSLYPYCRASVSHTTAESPFSVVTLPTVDFFAITEEIKDDDGE